MSSSRDKLMLPPPSAQGLTPESFPEVEAVLCGMFKFPGSKVDEYLKLAGLDKHNIYPVIISVPHYKPGQPGTLPNLPISGNGFVFLETNGSGLERISNLKLKEMGFELSPVIADKIDAAWALSDRLLDEGINSVVDSVPLLSLNSMGADGSIAVSSATRVQWTVMGGRELLLANYERIKDLPPEITCQLSALDVLRATSGVPWTVRDAAQLLMYIPVRGMLPFSAINGEDLPLPIGPQGSKVFKENTSDNFCFRMLSSPAFKVGEILRTAGKNIDTQIGAGILSVVGVSSQPVFQANDNGEHITPYECFRIACYALSASLMFSSWMLKPTPGGTSGKEKRLNAMSHLTAGGAVISAFAAIFCNIFAPIPLPYAACAIAACVLFLLVAAAYNAFSK